MAVCGQKKKGIIVGMRQQQLHGIPKYDTNNVVFVEVKEHPLINIIQFTQKTGYLLSLITYNFFKFFVRLVTKKLVDYLFKKTQKIWIS